MMLVHTVIVFLQHGMSVLGGGAVAIELQV